MPFFRQSEPWIQVSVTWKQCYRINPKFYPENPERQVLESSRERQDSNPDHQKVKSTENKKLSKMKVFRNILLDNHYNTTDQRLKLLRTQL